LPDLQATLLDYEYEKGTGKIFAHLSDLMQFYRWNAKDLCLPQFVTHKFDPN